MIGEEVGVILTRLAVSKILGGSAERINAGRCSPGVQETSSSVYHVVSGRGYSVVNGERIEWKQGETTYLSRFHDKPMLESLGFYRVDGVDVETLVSD